MKRTFIKIETILVPNNWSRLIIIDRSNWKNENNLASIFIYSLSWRKYDLDLKSQQCLLKMSKLPWPVQRLFKESYDRIKVSTPTTTAATATPTTDSKELMKPVSWSSDLISLACHQSILEYDEVWILHNIFYDFFFNCSKLRNFLICQRIFLDQSNIT